MTTPALLRGVDLAAFAAGLVARLRRAGVTVSASGQAGFVHALRELPPHSRSALYWSARLTLVNRVDELASFDAVFAEIFGGVEMDGPEHHPIPLPGPRTPAAGTVHRGAGQSSVPQAQTLPWVTRGGADPDSAAGLRLPDVAPSRIAALADESFERFDPDDLRLLGSWLEASVRHWPQRRSMRTELNPHGKRIDLRATIDASRLSGWEVLTLARTRPRRRPRRVVLACDVSRSMQPYATIYLHLMRATALRQAGLRPEVFAFSTSLTRLTAVLSHRSPEVALQRANAKVVDRYGGTFIGRNIEALLGPPHGNALRGAVVIIASDGWDSDPPDTLRHAMARLRRRADLVVWLNPRAAQHRFQPAAGAMAAALPYCDLFMPAHSLSALQEVLQAIAGRQSQPWLPAIEPSPASSSSGELATRRCRL
ncbi:vWA domain-containing protein [Mycobacterium asiaticum]|uniref:vWA domain-containing protein n=1 Tax=Mycobacterium asiaticum TaxID=1790 RepID=UPI0009BE71D9|nr:VWA domain-containing protein [Mycobacterium asiaticum]